MIIHFIDTETTGLDPVLGAEIVELAIARWEDGAVEELLHRPFMPSNGCPEEAAKVNGYNEAEWLEAGAKEFGIADAKEIAALVKGAYIGGSNPDFDKRMIEGSCHRVGQPKPEWSHRSLNTASLAWPLWATGQVKRTGLVELAQFFGIEHEAHTAMGDVRASIEVWESLFDLFIHRPKVMRDALIEIANDEQTDAVLRSFADRASRGEECTQ
jgi:DNA polymerase-3 subunit epsilon